MDSAWYQRRPSLRTRVLLSVVAASFCSCFTDAREQSPDLVAPDEDSDAPTPMGSIGAAPQLPMTQPVSTIPPGQMQDSIDTPEPNLAERGACAGSIGRIMTGVDEIYGLAVTSSKVYVGTYTGVRVTGRNGGAEQRVVEHFVQRILADDERLFWSDASLNLNVQRDGGDSSEFLPTHGAIEGVSQDSDSIYAISDGYLVRVSKQTKAVTPLVQSTPESPLHWSGTAVDATHVYFVSYGSGSDLTLERVRKDGSGRERLASGVGELMMPVEMLVDERHVYAATPQLIVRVPVAGGKLEQFATVGDSFNPRLSIAHDARCVYYAMNRSLFCVSKVEGSREQVATVPDGRLREIAVAGTDIYFGVYIDGPGFDARSWVGRVACKLD